MKKNMQEFNPKHYKFIEGEYLNRKVIWVEFPYDKDLVNHLKEHTKARWSRSNKKWYVLDVAFYRELFNMKPKSIGKKTLIQIHSINQPAFEKYCEQLQLKGYSLNTIRSYTREFAQLLKAIKSYPVDQITTEKLRSYFLYCIKTLKLSENAIHSRMNAIKFYFDQVLRREKFFMEIPRPKKPSLLPKALSTFDVKKMLATISNSKHLLLMKMCYGMGLRVSELVNLKITDIDSKRMQVLISLGKGKKDRYVILPESILEQLRTYYLEYKPKDYLFEGQYGGQYSIRSVQYIFKNAMQKAKINKKVGVHSLKHSYATHLIEQGVDIRFVQDLLGHNNIKTTMIYTNLTDQTRRKIKSPLDGL